MNAEEPRPTPEGVTDDRGTDVAPDVPVVENPAEANAAGPVPDAVVVVGTPPPSPNGEGGSHALTQPKKKSRHGRPRRPTATADGGRVDRAFGARAGRTDVGGRMRYGGNHVTVEPGHQPRRRDSDRAAAEKVREPWRPLLGDRGKPRQVWREQVLTRCEEVSAVAVWLDGRTDRPSTPTAGWVADEVTGATVRDRLATARAAARGRARSPWARKALMERAFGEVDGAEAALLRKCPETHLRGQLPSLVAHVQAHLPPKHPERLFVESLVAELEEADERRRKVTLTDADRSGLHVAVLAASSAARREHLRLRSLRMIISLTTLALFVMAVAIAVVSWLQPTWMPLCFAPAGSDAVVCPTTTNPMTVAAGGEGTGTPSESPGDAAATARTSAAIEATASSPDATLVMLLGLAAAAVTGAVALRRMRGTSTPFAVPVALLALKLPLGALTAFFGLLLIHGQIVPGLSALDTSGQILAWALLFGAAQQLVTGLVDKKAQDVLDSVGPSPMTSENE